MTVAFFCRQHPHSSAGHTEAATALVRQARKERCDTYCADNIVICLCQFPLITLFIHRDRYRCTKDRYGTGTRYRCGVAPILNSIICILSLTPALYSHLHDSHQPGAEGQAAAQLHLLSQDQGGEGADTGIISVVPVPVSRVVYRHLSQGRGGGADIVSVVPVPVSRVVYRHLLGAFFIDVGLYRKAELS